ncbi:MAG: hypothetical protein ACF787_09305 [Rhodopirellula sp. JB053]
MAVFDWCVVQEALTQLAVRKGDWKYIPPGSITERGGVGIWKETKVDEPGFLFHLAEDPGEQNNVAEQYPGKLNELREIIFDIAPGKMTDSGNLDKKKQLGF